MGEVMRKYLECGDLPRGFACLGCNGCRYQAILSYSCKCRLFCQLVPFVSLIFNHATHESPDLEINKTDK